VKAMRAGRAQLKEAYAYLRGGEAFLIGAHLSPLPTTSTHIPADPVRTRKLLLHRNELQRLIGAVERRGYTLVPLELYWKNGRAKLQLGLAKGKKQHDKRAVEKERDWQRDKARLLRRG
jgi:SsrA-binding protein